MAIKLSIQFKAALLLLVFALNTAGGCVCAMGLDMGCKMHHCNKRVPNLPVHPAGMIHQHKKVTDNHGQLHKQEKCNCCSDAMIKFSRPDKAIPQSGVHTSPVSLIEFAHIYYIIEIAYPSQISGSSKYFARSYHPPIPDICIAVQRFQI